MIPLVAVADVVAQSENQQQQSRDERIEALRQERKALTEKLKAETTQKALEQLFASRIEKFAKSKKLSPDNVAHLRVAAKGAIKQHLRAMMAPKVDLPVWAEDFPGYYHRSGPLTFLGNFSRKAALQQPVWVDATDKFRSQSEIKNRQSREQFRLRTYVDLFIVRLDNKLKFTHQQRNALRDLLSSKFGAQWKNYRFAAVEEYWIFYPLSNQVLQLTAEELEPVIGAKRLAKWNPVVESLAERY